MESNQDGLKLFISLELSFLLVKVFSANKAISDQRERDSNRASCYTYILYMPSIYIYILKAYADISASTLHVLLYHTYTCVLSKTYVYKYVYIYIVLINSTKFIFPMIFIHPINSICLSI